MHRFMKVRWLAKKQPLFLINACLPVLEGFCIQCTQVIHLLMDRETHNIITCMHISAWSRLVSYLGLGTRLGRGRHSGTHTCSYTHVAALDRTEYHSVAYFECTTTCIVLSNCQGWGSYALCRCMTI